MIMRDHHPGGQGLPARLVDLRGWHHVDEYSVKPARLSVTVLLALPIYVDLQ